MRDLAMSETPLNSGPDCPRTRGRRQRAASGRHSVSSSRNSHQHAVHSRGQRADEAPENAGIAETNHRTQESQEDKSQKEKKIENRTSEYSPLRMRRKSSLWPSPDFLLGWMNGTTLADTQRTRPRTYSVSALSAAPLRRVRVSVYPGGGKS